MIAEILSAVLPGAGATKKLRDWLLYPNLPALIGHSFAAIDVSRFQEISAFKTCAALLGKELREGPKAQGTNRLFIPGDLENEAGRRSLSLGVYVSAHAGKGLLELAQEEGVSLDPGLMS